MKMKLKRKHKFHGLLDNLFLYLSLNRGNFQMVKGINNQVYIIKSNGIIKNAPHATRKLWPGVQPDGRKTGHNKGLQLIGVH
jgi:hypothetical protein